MDLGAYVQKDGNLNELAKANGIEVARLRGYRLMAREEPWTEQEVEKRRKDLEGTYWWMESSENPDWQEHTCEEYVNGYRPPTWNRMIDFVPDKKNPEGDYVMRKIGIFHEISCLRGRIVEQARCWNAYAGKEGVLYIHSRCGRGWRNYRNEPWFLDGCLDAFDPTYCDIYAKVEGYE